MKKLKFILLILVLGLQEIFEIIQFISGKIVDGFEFWVKKLDSNS